MNKNKLDVIKWDKHRKKTYRVATINLDKNNLSRETIDKLIVMWCIKIKPTKYLPYKSVVEMVRVEIGFNNFIEFYNMCVHLKSCGRSEIVVLNYANDVLNKLGGS